MRQLCIEENRLEIAFEPQELYRIRESSFCVFKNSLEFSCLARMLTAVPRWYAIDVVEAGRSKRRLKKCQLIDGEDEPILGSVF